MAVIEVYTPNEALGKEVNDHSRIDFYANLIEPAMREWLNRHVGPPTLSYQIDKYKNPVRGWSLAADGLGNFVFYLDTTDAIAVEFKLKWL